MGQGEEAFISAPSSGSEFVAWISGAQRVRNGADPIRVVAGYPLPWPERVGARQRWALTAWSWAAGSPASEAPSGWETCGDGQLRTDSHNRNKQRPWHPSCRQVSVGDGAFPASLWSTGKGGKGPGPCPGHTSALHPCTLLKSMGDVQSGWSKETEAQRCSPAQRLALPAQPSASSLKITHHASRSTWGHTLSRKWPVSVPKGGGLFLSPDLEAGSGR